MEFVFQPELTLAGQDPVEQPCGSVRRWRIRNRRRELFEPMGSITHHDKSGYVPNFLYILSPDRELYLQLAPIRQRRTGLVEQRLTMSGKIQNLETEVFLTSSRKDGRGKSTVECCIGSLR
jgi:hypothetical protein